MGPYRLLHPVWRDRFGMTHIGRGPDGAPAAIRVLPPALARDPAVVRRAGTAVFTGIRHPNLAGVKDILVDDEGIAIAADAVLGTPLRSWRGPLTVARFRQISSELVAGLLALHSHGVTHRNLSASNVMIDRTGRVVLTDIAVGHVVGSLGSVHADLDALDVVLTDLWRRTHMFRPVPDVWVDTMARAPDMG
jgi:serine/threonine protein kinase